MSLTTTWSAVYPTLDFNGYYSTNIAVRAVPAAYSFSYSLAVATGYPSLYVVQPSIFTSWISTSAPVPRSYNYGALLPAPGNHDTATLVFTAATTYPVFIYCGPYDTTISATVSTVTQNCSGITINAKWVDFNLSPVVATSSIPPRTSAVNFVGTTVPTDSLTSDAQGQVQSTNLSIGAVIGIAIACFFVAGIVAAGVLVLFLRRRNKAAAAKAHVPHSSNNYPPPPPATSEFRSQETGQSHLYFTPSVGVNAPQSYYPQNGLGESAMTFSPPARGVYQANYPAHALLDPNAFLAASAGSEETGNSSSQGIPVARN
ncbi:hypothetical protein BJ742DRAFT_466705 [Cladochytrium replicatum]|nr:hypothetical protein BJ742DRAFT_466705 [Cladochytrium replicatum]